MLNITLDDKSSLEVVTQFYELNEKFNKSIDTEKKKYPLSDRETLFVNTMNELLDILDRGYRR
jgi:hypothetical protein